MPTANRVFEAAQNIITINSTDTFLFMGKNYYKCLYVPIKDGFI
jgi:hypothetical protein